MSPRPLKELKRRRLRDALDHLEQATSGVGNALLDLKGRMSELNEVAWHLEEKIQEIRDELRRRK